MFPIYQCQNPITDVLDMVTEKSKAATTWPYSPGNTDSEATGFQCPVGSCKKGQNQNIQLFHCSHVSQANVTRTSCMPCGRQGSDNCVENQDPLCNHLARGKLKKLGLKILNKNHIDNVAYTEVYITDKKLKNYQALTG